MESTTADHVAALAVPDALSGERIGLLAGWGRFPIVVAEAIRRRGGRPVILSIRDHADAVLPSLADVHGDVGVAEIGTAIAFFRRHGVRRATTIEERHHEAPRALASQPQMTAHAQRLRGVGSS